MVMVESGGGVVGRVTHSIVLPVAGGHPELAVVNVW